MFSLHAEEHRETLRAGDAPQPSAAAGAAFTGEKSVLIDMHAHHLTEGMLDRHDRWGPFVTARGLKVGEWVLGTSTHRQQADDATAKAKLLAKMDLGSRIGRMDASGIDRLVLSVPAHLFMYWASDFGDDYAGIVNDELAAAVSEHPDRFSFWGHANLAEPVAAAKELERAVTQLGAVGLSMGGANFGGMDAHDERLWPVWAKACELDVPLFVHGYNQSVTWQDERTDPFDTTSIVGMCRDETRLFWHLISGGVLDHFPELKVYITHGGGFVPYQLQRFHETNKTMAPDSRNKRDVLEYLTNFWFDLDIHSQNMRRAIVRDLGVERLVYGSNFGGADSHVGDLTEGLELTNEERELIRSGNALELLRLG